MFDQKTLLALAAAGLFLTAPAARSLAAAPVVRFASLTAAAAPDEDDEKKGPEKGEKKDKEDDEKSEKGDEHEGKERGEKKEVEQAVPMDMVPAAVLDVVKKEVPGGTITEAELEAKRGKIMWAFDVKAGEMAYDVKVTVDGKFFEKKVDDEKDEKPAAGEKK